MNLVACQNCGVVADFSVCCERHGVKEQGGYYGSCTKCPACGYTLFEEEVSRYLQPFDELPEDDE